MNRFMLILISLAIFITAVCWPNNLDNAQIRKEIPSEISEYYEDYNFVSSFSSSDERKELMNYLSERELPEKFKSERLKKILRLMKRIRAKILRYDPKIVTPAKPHSLYIFHSELIEVKNFHHKGKAVEIKVLVYDLEPEKNFRFISLYEKHNGDEKEILPVEIRIQAAKSEQAPRIEIHKWVYTKGRWLKRDANIVLIKDKGYPPESFKLFQQSCLSAQSM